MKSQNSTLQHAIPFSHSNAVLTKRQFKNVNLYGVFSCKFIHEYQKSSFYLNKWSVFNSWDCYSINLRVFFLGVSVGAGEEDDGPLLRRWWICVDHLHPFHHTVLVLMVRVVSRVLGRVRYPRPFPMFRCRWVVLVSVVQVLSHVYWNFPSRCGKNETQISFEKIHLAIEMNLSKK